jgi:subtilase family serine protease
MVTGMSSLRQRALASVSSIALVAALGVTGAPSVAHAVASGVFSPAVGVSPQVRYAGQPTGTNTSVHFACQLPGGDFVCYGPDQIKHAYQIDQTGLTGAGRTIVIVDAYQNPYVTQELHDFDALWGLADPPSFDIVAPDGLTPFDFDDDNMVGWSGEISLDVQWAHSVAPGARMVLVLAKSSDDGDIVSALGYAIHHNLGDVVSMSFGEAEQCFSPLLDAREHLLFTEAAARGITLVASSGDDGAAQPGCSDDAPDVIAASTPAADPLVLGVGGTNLTADLTTGTYQSEVAWDDCCGQSGGGFSTRYTRPAYQAGFHNKSGRGVPDVAYNAGVDTGVITAWYVPFGPDEFFVFGGTSAGAPQWAGISALADQKAGHRVGWVNPALYTLSRVNKIYAQDFHDITVGNNVVPGLGGFKTATGWDPVTGLGTPIVSSLLKAVGPLAPGP